MSDETQALRLLGEMERLQRAEDLELAEPSPTAAADAPMTALLASLVENDFDLGRTIVDSANGA
ncbi:hypothetical protein [Ornithinimicrobium avium]|uniref:Uncharacterized protein n=1 Tax=Ornithinimicrobium avium TaxID=2283195 RepID=A0A345NNL7_9MICO|nr:hypothetical protein [Ornithinimicrobium avium]AXH96625.1 hypothetical protein DV701_11270 [Ornithinimicrobium avium]